jgi:chromosomal replication initiation ATPase DnaA
MSIATMSKEKDLSQLLANLKEALNHYEIAELNRAIIEILGKKNTSRQNKINVTLSYVCEKYKISKRMLLNSKYNRDLDEPKKIFTYILCLTFGIPSKYVALNVFYFKNHSSVAKRILEYKKLNTKLKQDRDLIEKFTQSQKEVLELMASNYESGEQQQ